MKTKPISVIGIKKQERHLFLSKWSSLFNWDNEHVSKLLGITVRHVLNYERNTVPIPDSKWKLFIHEILFHVNELDMLKKPVFIFDTDEKTIIDIVTNYSFVSYSLFDNDNICIVETLMFDKIKKQSITSCTVFKTKFNKNTIDVFDLWLKNRLEKHQEIFHNFLYSKNV